jgi:hypothetical protein
MVRRYRVRAAAGASLAIWLALAGAALSQASRQIVVTPAKPADATAQTPEAPPAASPEADSPESASPASSPAETPAPETPATARVPAPPASAQPVAEAAAPPADCSAHTFIQPEDVVAAIAADLDRLKSRARGARYLTLTQFANVCTAGTVMEVYRQGAIKLANSLSRSSDVVKVEPIDPERSILRINIDDLGWDAADWDKLIAAYPYAAQPDTKLFAVLQAATETKLPYVRADWFAFTAARPPLYTTLLKLPGTHAALAQQQGVDIAADIKKFVAQRAGFQSSGESPNNRLIERHPSHSGFFWTTYDFAGNRARQSVFEFPLGPGGQNGFDHDGSETAFSLPNGFVGYFIAAGKGEALESAPVTIVRDQGRRDVTITTGISCIGCHADGTRAAADEVRASVFAGRIFPKSVRDAVEALYPASEQMDQVFADDARRFAAAMSRAGLDPSLRLGNSEPVNALSERFDALLDTRLAAAELGLTADDFVAAVNDNRKYRPLLFRLNQGAVSRSEFEGRFAELIGDLTDEDMIELKKPEPVVAPAKPAPHAAPSPSARTPRSRSPAPYSYR